ncbi:cellulose synthase A catalytic subunit 7 [UDP-forming] [Trifolium repens]|nr:cellulose synthase A catalytic subunit 7 [UDP-forming] [Trifolium repens]
MVLVAKSLPSRIWKQCRKRLLIEDQVKIIKAIKEVENIKVNMKGLDGIQGPVYVGRDVFSIDKRFTAIVHLICLSYQNLHHIAIL